MRLPLVLMNSDATREATEQALADHPEIEHEGIAPDFVQSMIPKLDADDLTPVELAAGAGARMVPAGPRRRLRRAAALGDARPRCSTHGFRYAMISNSDNLGAAARPAGRRPTWPARRSRS